MIVETAQYWIAIVHVVSFPPVMLAWLVTHQFIQTWRRVGIAWTYVVLSALTIPCWIVLGLLHKPIMATSYGVSWPLIVLSIIAEALAFVVGVPRMRQAGGAVISGFRELKATDDDPGGLITGGI